MPCRKFAVVCFALTAVIGGPAATANLVLNPGFETGYFTDWSITGDGISIDRVFPNTGCCDAAFSALTTDPNAGVLSQTLSTVAGKSYKLGFVLLDEAGFSGDSFTVQFGGFSASITGDEAGPPGDLPSLYTAFSFTVPGTDIMGGATALAFKGLNDPASGIEWNLDDVSANAGIEQLDPAHDSLREPRDTAATKELVAALSHESLVGAQTSRPRPPADSNR
jgi:hypothetical protein